MTTEPRDETGGDPEALAVEAERALESGRAATAEALYSRALDMRPAEESWLMGRATARRFLARHEEALADVEAALAGNPGNLRLRLERGYALRAAGLNDAAETAYRSILADRPDQAEARVNLGMLLRAAHRTEEAVAVLQRAATRRPGDARVLTALGTARLEAGDVPGAARDLGQAMSANPWDRNALAHLYAAACAAGDFAAAEALFPAEDTLAVVDDVLGEDEAAALVTVIKRDPTLAWERSGNTTRGGAHTGILLDDPDPLVVRLADKLDGALRAYLAGLRRDERHPYLAWRPEHWRLEIWGVVLASGGYQEPHIHPDGWVSGVCYLAVPPEVGSDPGDAGCLEVGRPPSLLRPRDGLPVRGIRPRPGRTVMFPSFAWHRTVPFASDSERICVAFDLRPMT